MSNPARELEFKQTLLLSQCIQLVVLAVAALGVWIISWFFPDFFPYSYFKWGGWGSVAKFWPLFLWGLIAAISSSLDRVPIYAATKQQLLGYGLATSLLAGLWEEMAFRWIFICYAMISIIATNFIFGSVVAWILVAVLGVAALAGLAGKSIVGGLAAAAVAIGIGWLSMYVDPVYWFYENIIVNIIHFATFTQMDPILYGGHEKTFIFGAILANAWFRDGHKYQGGFGLVNSWYAGMVLLYATLTYGLWTAVVIHALYDIIFDVVRFVLTRTKEPSASPKFSFQ